MVPALRNQDGHKFKVSLYLACLEYVRPCPRPLQKTKQKDVTKQGEQGGALEDSGLFSAPLGAVLSGWLRIWMQEPKTGINKQQQKQTKQSKQMKNTNPPGTPALDPGASGKRFSVGPQASSCPASSAATEPLQCLPFADCWAPPCQRQTW